MQSLGNFVGGAFVAPSGPALISRNPARGGAVVLETASSAADASAAVAAAANAFPAWRNLSRAQRWDALTRFRDAIRAHATPLADAIVLETGKIRSEANTEIQTLLNRFDLVRAAVEADQKEGPVAPGETLRFTPLGVIGVIGPFNFPLHLCHAHVIPALLTGNTVVVKPSDITPLCGQRYAEAALAAGLPPGVLNVVTGGADVGGVLTRSPDVRGICFTGSWAVGRRILDATLDRPEVLVALEMGGKNMSVVLDDASLRQAVHEIAVGGFLSAGQRCTGTDRVLVQKDIAPRFVAAMRELASALRFGNPEDAAMFAGPLATDAALLKLETAINAARAAGAEPVVAGQRLDGGAFRTASLHRLPHGQHHVAGYTDIEVFGPDLCVETFDTDDEAIALVAASEYGFANAVFTASRPRFERFFQHVRSGILNCNRSTNLASPRLPFGGIGKSGNYRPAGAWSHRNVTAPVAILENVHGAVVAHPQLAALLPPPDLTALEAQHHEEEAAEMSRRLLDAPRPMRMMLPAGGALPASDALLGRMYAGDRVAKEKKPNVVDHLRSAGPWMVSVDASPLSVLDAMSQTATNSGGFAEDPVVQALVEGKFGPSLTANADTAAGHTRAWTQYANTLRQLVPGLPHVTFVASGAEANEKAIALAHANCKHKQARKILAFDGSFHGRTLTAIHATHSPSKRTPFELPGYEATFAPYPVWNTPGEEPAAPSGYFAACAAGSFHDLLEKFAHSHDALLVSEIRALLAVHEALATKEYVCVIIEPMQCEGGDRYATERFFRGLRLLTRHHQVALIFDEVQTGFGLAGSFAWHSKFRLMSGRGQPDYPDAVTFAKRAQVGVVMSRFSDPERGSAHNASLVRGNIHAEMVATTYSAQRLEALVRPRLDAIARAYPQLVAHPRAAGYAFAFDLPSAAHLDAFLAQRFWRGAVVFAAGTRTARYRLNDAFWAREVDELFLAIRRSLSWLDAHPGKKPPAWDDAAAVTEPARELPPVRLIVVPHTEVMQHLPAILAMEAAVYEPARQTPPEEITAAIQDPEGSLILAMGAGAEGTEQLLGFAIAGPLEHAKTVEGPDDDAMLGKHNTLYSVSITVGHAHQSSGLGRRLKELQLRDAATRKRPDGTPRYLYVTGRNRVGLTAQMTHLNRAYGAHVVSVLTGQYEDPEGQAIYYRIPLGAMAPNQELLDVAKADDFARERELDPAPVRYDLAQGLTQPFAVPPKSLLVGEAEGLLSGAAINKLTLMNYATPASVRATEYVASLTPELPHLYLTNSRDEAFDKSLRLLRLARKKASVVLGLSGGYVGHTIGSARSLSDPRVHSGGPAYFSWPRVPHPKQVGAAASLAELRAAITAHGADAIWAIVFEPVQERTGATCTPEFYAGLAALRAEFGVPLVAIETACHTYRSGAGAFVYPTIGFVPDVVAWWGGGQTGYVHCQAKWFVGTPLALVSTWDGDELSLIREQHQLRAARALDLTPAVAAMDHACRVATERGANVDGMGLYRVLDTGDRTAMVAHELAQRGLPVRMLPGERLAIIPPLDAAEPAANELAAAFLEVL